MPHCVLKMGHNEASKEIAERINSGDSKDLSYPPVLASLMDDPCIENEAALAKWIEAIIDKHCK